MQTKQALHRDEQSGLCELTSILVLDSGEPTTSGYPGEFERAEDKNVIGWGKLNGKRQVWMHRAGAYSVIF